VDTAKTYRWWKNSIKHILIISLAFDENCGGGV
jgi:hypothetical protein